MTPTTDSNGTGMGMHGDPANKDTNVAATAPPRRSRRPRVWGLVLIAGMLLLVALVHLAAFADALPIVDFAVANLLTLAIGFVGTNVLAVGCAVFSRGWVRFVPLALVLAAQIAFFTTFRILQTTGELIPTFTWRWAPLPDERLETPSAPALEQPVDLATTGPRDFPQFLGPDRSGRITGARLAFDWDSRPPRRVWQQPIGAGWSAFSAVNGFAVTMEQRGDDELVTCYEITTGQLKWFHATKTRHRTIPGGVGPRSTPTIHDGRVYTLGATGVLLCLDGATGDAIWQVSLFDMIGVTETEDLEAVAWGRAASPLVVDDLVVVPLGGPAGGPYHSLAAFHIADGTLAWKGGSSQVAYASPRLATLAGVRQILIVNESSVSGHDPENGNELWSHPWPGHSNSDASCSQAVPVGDDRVLLSKGYGIGASLIELTSEAGTLRPQTLWNEANLLKTKFANAVIVDGHAYALSDGILECVEIESGSRRWKQGRYRQGQILSIDDTLLVLGESGELAVVACTPEGYSQRARLPVLDGTTWNNLCLYGNYLLVRNAEMAACLEVAVSE